MIRTWRAKQKLLHALTSILFLVGVVAIARRFSSDSSIPPGTAKEANFDLISDINIKSESKPSRPSTVSNLPMPTEEAIAAVASTDLHRMNPPAAMPPTPVAPIAETPPPVLFPGQLIGIIQDALPEFSYAVLRWPDNRIQLVAQGSPLTEEANALIVQRIESAGILLKSGDQEQKLDLGGPL